jgi:hypothetical protein
MHISGYLLLSGNKIGYAYCQQVYIPAQPQVPIKQEKKDIFEAHLWGACLTSPVSSPFNSVANVTLFTRHAVHRSQHRPWCSQAARTQTVHDKSCRQNIQTNYQANNKTKRLPVSVEMLPAVQTAWSFCWIQMPVLFLHNSHLITSSDRDLFVT